MAKFQVIIGRAETIDLVGRALNVPAKVDTGAFRSAIHATDIKVVKKEGVKTLTCTLLGHPCFPEVYSFETKSFKQVQITNSFGQEETRYEVNLRIKLGPKVVTTSFTLADRSKNLFPILIGRKLLKGRYIVDVSKANINRLVLKKQAGHNRVDDEDLE